MCSAGAIFVWYSRHCCIKWQLSGRRKGESFSVGQERKLCLGGYHWGQMRKEWQRALANSAESRCSQCTCVHSQNLRAQHMCTHMHTHAHMQLACSQAMPQACTLLWSPCWARMSGLHPGIAWNICVHGVQPTRNETCAYAKLPRTHSPAP